MITLKLTERQALRLKQFVDGPSPGEMEDDWLKFLDVISDKIEAEFKKKKTKGTPLVNEEEIQKFVDEYRTWYKVGVSGIPIERLILSLELAIQEKELRLETPERRRDMDIRIIALERLLDEVFAAFNALESNKKWDAYRILENVTWTCKHCGDVMEDGPHRASPFPGSEVCCGNCDDTLTRRTGGGQSDPFGWVAKRQRKG